MCLFFCSLLLCRFDFQTALQHLRTERLSTTRGYSAAPRLGTREGSRTCSVRSSMWEWRRQSHLHQPSFATNLSVCWHSGRVPAVNVTVGEEFGAS